jgi:threonine/homoserine/homoserine lactone efflux protein
MTWQLLASFLLLCLLLALTPGPDSFLVLRYAMVSTRSGVAAAAGSAVATLCWAAAVGLGLAAILEQSAVAFRVVKVAGGLYLLYLGVSTLLQHRREAGTNASAGPERDGAVPASTSRVRATTRGAFLAGFVSTTLNPKVGLFFVAVVPQYLRDDHADFRATMLLGSISAVVALAYLSLLSFVARRAIDWLRRPHVADRLEKTSAGVLAVLGLGTLVSATR